MLSDDPSTLFACDGRAISASQNVTVGKKFTLFVKRSLDIGITAASLPFVAPFIGIVALYIWAKGGAPVFFVHKRVGKGGRPFGCLKFRTMQVNADQLLQRYLDENPEAKDEWDRTQKLENDPRVIPGIGNLLRETSFDELPQLYNVLKGEMSLVGPRPVTREELKRYGASVEHYVAVRPGITGRWQVSGRNQTSYDERVRLDVDYVDTLSTSQDLSLLFKTVAVVLKRDGAT